MGKLRSILAVGEDEALLWTRVEILRRHYEADGVRVGEATEALRRKKYDALLLCHSTPAEEGELLVRWVKERYRGLPVVALTSPMRRAEPSGADLVVDVSSDPEHWVAAVEALMSGAGATLRGIGAESVARTDGRAGSFLGLV